MWSRSTFWYVLAAINAAGWIAKFLSDKDATGMGATVLACIALGDISRMEERNEPR